jgi:cellulose synthase operon protein B
MEKRNKKNSVYGIFILFMLIFMSAFSLNTVQGQQAEGTPTPVPDSGGAVFEAYAAYTPTPLPEISSYGSAASFSFRNMGVAPFPVHFPSIGEADFAFPNQWDIAPAQSEFIIHYDLFEEGVWGFGRPFVEVYINGFFAGTFEPIIGENQTVRIGWPSALVNDRAANPLNAYTIEFWFIDGGGDSDVSGYDYDVWCDYNGVLNIREESEANLVFRTAGAFRGLETFPRPLVQDSFIPETLYMVLPDSYSESDLVALDTVASAIGRGTAGEIKLEVLRASEATPQMLANSNAVIIGQPGNNAFITDLYNAGVLPTGYDGTSISGAGADDGVLQLIASTENTANSFLVVSGNSENGVIKAAQTLSDPPIGISGTEYIAKSDVQDIPEIVQEEDFAVTFAELGLANRTIYGNGTRGTLALFYIPRNWEIQDGSNLVINYSTGTNDIATESAMNVYLNELPIAAPTIDYGVVGEQELVIPLKRSQILPGSRNVIRIETIISEPSECKAYNPRTTWMTIRDTSFLYLPYVEYSGEMNLPPIFHPLYYLVNEQTVLFSLPSAPGQDVLNSMANLSFNLGSGLSTYQTGFEFLVSLKPDFDFNSYGDVSAVMIGKPTDNNAIARLNDELPQPFLAGANSLTPKNYAGGMRTSEDVSIGVIQALQAPWNPFKVVTVVTGTTDDGLTWALENASNAGAYGSMIGDVVFVRETQVQAFQSNSSFSVPLESVLVNMADEPVIIEEVQPVVSPPTSEEVEAPSITNDQYIREDSASQFPVTGKYALLGMIIIGLLIAGVALARAIRGGRTRG